MTTPQVDPVQSVFRQMHLRDYRKIVWQGRWTLAAIFLVVVSATAVWTFMRVLLLRDGCRLLTTASRGFYTGLSPLVSTFFPAEGFDFRSQASQVRKAFI